MKISGKNDEGNIPGPVEYNLVSGAEWKAIKWKGRLGPDSARPQIPC